MNSNFCCVRCEQNARFVCARCSDPYCSKTCQVLHWPFHRTMCLSMPSLLEIPTSGNLVLPICDKRSNNSPAIEYPNWDSHQYNVSPKTFRKTSNYEKSISSNGVPPFKEFQRNKTYSRDNYTNHAKKSNPALEAQRHTSNESIKLTEPIPIREGTQRSTYKQSQNTFSTNFTDFPQSPKFESRKSENSFPIIKTMTQRGMQKNSQNWDKSASEIPQLTKTESFNSGRSILLQENKIQRTQNLDEPILNLQELSIKESHECENPRPIFKKEIQRSMTKSSSKQDMQRLEMSKTTKTELKNCGNFMPLQENGAKRLLSSLSINWDEEETARFPSDPLIWQKAFALPENKIEVIVQYFVESPTISCWVIQSRHIKERDNLLAEVKKLHSDVKAVRENEIRINEVYCVQREDVYHRCVVVYQINSKEVVVRLIDDGRSFQTLISTIKPLNPQVKFKNAFALEINFETSLEIHVGQILQIEKFSIDAVGAINVQLLPGDRSNEIDLIPVPVGVPMDLFCLDYSNIEMGYISACKNDPQKIESINNLSDKINEYVRKFQKGEKYFPKLDEMCLVYHDNEKEWYRAECVKIISPSCIEVLFIDFGNTKIVNTLNVRRMVAEFMEPAIMHFFRIYGVPQKPSRELIKKISSFFDDNPIFSITRVESFDNMQVIHCPDLLNAIHP